MKILTIIFLIAVVVYMGEVNSRLDRLERSVGYLNDNFIAIVPDYYEPNKGTTEQFMTMDNVNYRLTKIEDKQDYLFSCLIETTPPSIKICPNITLEQWITN